MAGHVSGNGLPIMNNGSKGDLVRVVDDLCDPGSYHLVYHRANHDIPMPSIEDLNEIVDKLKSVLFPGFFAHSDVRPETMKYYIGSTLDSVLTDLAEQIKRGECFSCPEGLETSCVDCDLRAKQKANRFLLELPRIRHLLALDAQAAYNGDPAARGVGEAIFCYPSMAALTNYRIAHELFRLDVQLIPRIITEMAHSATGIDIHPGAEIGESLFIDHGTGTVIGETCVIGSCVRIYQGVTLGAKHFPLDAEGRPIKGIPRHPIVEDNVIIYSGATILGRVTIGRGAEIGGNVWLTQDVPPGSRIVQGKPD
jgi:serine O-acetyltransferase